MTGSNVEKTWSTESGAVMRAIRRPDGAWLLRLPDRYVEEWGTLIQMAAREVTGPIVTMRPENQGAQADSGLSMAGFRPARREFVWRIPVASALAKPSVRTAHRIVPVDSLDLDDVAELDNLIRRDIPGTEGWVGTGQDLARMLDDPEFDPALYRIAQHSVTGSLDGLIRVWNRSPEPRLGAIGVTRPWRRTRLALALVQDVARTLYNRGVTHITAETDATNRDSHVMARRQGGEEIRVTIEWQRPGRGRNVDPDAY